MQHKFHVRSFVTCC